MEAVNWLLVNGANALLWLWGLIESVFGATFAAVDAFVDPILAPVLGAVNPICSAVGDVVYAVLSPLPVWAGLTVLSAVAGVCMLIAFRFFSNQAGIGRARDDIKANLLALKLYKDDLRVTFQAQARLLWAILRLQRYVLTPVLVMLPPMLLGLAQMGVRYQWRPLRPGEQTNIVVTLNAKPEPLGVGPRLDSHTPPDTEVRLEPNPGATEAVGVPGGGRIVWRILAGEPGRHTLCFKVRDRRDNQSRTIEKDLVVGSDFQRVSAKRVGSDWLNLLLHPVERRLPPGGTIRSIEIGYPGADSYICGANWWMLYFFVVSMAVALALKPLFRVRF